MFTTVFFTNTLSSARGIERGARRHNRGFLRGGPAEVELSPFLFLCLQSGRCLRRWVQHYLGWRLAKHEWRGSGLAEQLVARLSLAVESVPSWGDVKQMQSWSA